MSRIKFYFRNADAELCYQKKYWLSEMKDEGLKELEVYEARPIKDDNFFFCKAVEECGEKGNCGRECEDYEPRNGKSGCCRHVGKLYEAGEKVLLKME